MKPDSLAWKIVSFKELSLENLYASIQLRIAVFCVEQNCPYQDVDGKDLQAFHVMGFDTHNNLIAYARILPAGISYKEISIGRIATSSKARRTGIGKLLMKKCFEFIKNNFGNVPVKIGAQAYLENFYKNFGFMVSGPPYLEDNIRHVEMLFMPDK